MANSQVLKEFLIALGFKVDEPGLKKFEKGVVDAEKASKEFAIAVTATAAAVTAAVVKIAGDFEDLYYASERLHSSARNIRATELSLQNMGTTAEGARGSLEGLAAFTRNNPGGESFINRLGVDTRDATGAARDMTDVMADLGKQFAAMPYPIARLRANLMGIDDITLQALIRGTDEFTRKAKARADSFGVDFKRASEEGLKFKRAMRDLGDTVYLSIVRLVLPVLRVVTPLIEKGVAAVEKMNRATGGWAGSLLTLVAVLAPVAFLAWRLFKVIGGLLEVLGLTGPAVGAVGAALGELLIPILAVVAAVGALWLLWDDFQTYMKGGDSLLDWGPFLAGMKDVKEAVGEFAAAFAADFATLSKAWDDFAAIIAPGVRLLGTLFADVFTNTIRAAIEGVTEKLHDMADAIRLGAALLRGDLKGAWKVNQDAAARHQQEAQARDVRSANAVGDWWHRLTGGGERRAGDPNRPQGPLVAPRPPSPVNDNSPVAQGVKAARGAMTATQQAMEFFQAQGWTRAQAAGLVANLFTESGLNPNAEVNTAKEKAYGIGQWHRDRQAEFQRWSGHSIRGSKLDEQLAFVQYELTRGAEKMRGRGLAQITGADPAARYIDRNYERSSGAKENERAALAEKLYTATPAPSARLTAGPAATAAAVGAVNVNQTTTIKVEGANDPQRTAERVASTQGAVNSDMVRNMRSAIN